MPIQFPQPDRDPPFASAANLFVMPGAVDITNLEAPGTELTDFSFLSGFVDQQAAPAGVNLSAPGFDISIDYASRMNPLPRAASDPQRTSLFFDYLSMTLTGVTRDANGAILAGCVVDLFDTLTDTKQQATVSDANGVFWFSLMAPGPYYVVSYKVGSPDVAGTSINILQPT